MSHSECRKSNDTTQYLVVHAEDYLPTPCNNMGNNNNEIRVERSFSVSPPSNHIEEDQRGEMSTPESDVQDSPLDFSLPKRSKSTASVYEPKTPYASSSPPLTMCSQRRSPPELGSKIPRDPYPTRPGSNGSKTPRNPYLAHHNNGSNIEMFANGPCVSSDAGQGRSQSFSSSVGKIRKHGIRPHSRGMPSGSGVGPLSTHHLNDPALIQNVTPAVTYANLVPQALPPSTSPSVTCIPNMVPNDVLEYCNDRRTKSTSDNCHYTFLPAAVPSCINSNFCRNGMLTAHPSVLSSSVHSSSSIHPSMQIGNVPLATPISHPSKSTVIVKSTSPTPTVTTSATSTTAKRRPRSLPDDQKDEAYWERRRKNNEAAKRSRDARRQKEEEVAMRASFLEQENIKLQTEVATLQTETEQLRVLLYEK